MGGAARAGLRRCAGESWAERWRMGRGEKKMGRALGWAREKGKVGQETEEGVGRGKGGLGWVGLAVGLFLFLFYFFSLFFVKLHPN